MTRITDYYDYEADLRNIAELATGSRVTVRILQNELKRQHGRSWRIPRPDPLLNEVSRRQQIFLADMFVLE